MVADASLPFVGACSSRQNSLFLYDSPLFSVLEIRMVWSDMAFFLIDTAMVRVVRDVSRSPGPCCTMIGAAVVRTYFLVRIGTGVVPTTG